MVFNTKLPSNEVYICTMNIYFGIINGIPVRNAHTSLRGICNELKVSYNSAIKGKSVWIKGDDMIILAAANLVKIKGRGNKKLK